MLLLAASLLFAAASSAPTLVAPVTSAQEAAPTDVVLSGSVVLPDGSPAKDVTWSIRGFRANRGRVDQFGLPKDWKDPVGTGGAQGELAIKFDPPPAFQFSLEVSCKGYVTERWRWGSLDPGGKVNLGEIRFRPSCTVTGTIIDKDGQPLTGRRWRVYGEEPGNARLNARGLARVAETVDPATAKFTLEGLPEGPITLRVNERQIGWSKKHSVELTAGGPTVKDIFLEEAAKYEGTIRVTVFIHDLYSYKDPSPSDIWLVAPDGTRQSAAIIPRAASGFVFEDVGEGPHRVEILDDRFDSWSQDNVEVNATLQARLYGSAALKLDVADAEGNPVEPYSVELEFQNVNFSPKKFKVVKGDQPLESDLIDHVPPAHYRMRVEADGMTALVDVPELKPSEQRTIAVTLREPIVVTGRVVYDDGSPAVGKLVRLVEPAKVNDSPDVFVLTANASTSAPERARKEIGQARTDASGWFRLSADEAVNHIVMVGGGGGPRTESGVLELGTKAGEERPWEDLSIVLGRPASVSGRIDFPAGLKASGCFVYPIKQGSKARVSSLRSLATQLDEEGRYQIEGLEPGSYKLYVRQGQTSGSSNGVPNGAKWFGDVELVSGEDGQLDAPYPGGAPVSFQLTFGGELPKGGVRTAALVSSRRELVCRRDAKAGKEGLDAFIAQPGKYTLWLMGDGWLASGGDIEILPTDIDAEIPVKVSVTQGRVRIMNGDKPLSKVPLQFSAQVQGLEFPELTTDDDGWLDLTLGEGSYRLYPNTQDMDLVFKEAHLEWPIAGEKKEVVLQ